MRTTLTTACLATLIAVPAWGQAYDLRGPAMNTETVYITHAQTNTEGGEMTMRIQGQTIEGTMTTEATQVIETTILEMDGDQPTRVRSDNVESANNTTVNMGGQVQNQSDTSMQGVVFEQVLTDDGWRTEIVQGNLPAEVAGLIDQASFADPRLMFPDEAVPVGHSWTLRDDEIGAFAGAGNVPWASFEGEMVCTLDEIIQVEGQDVAVISVEMDYDTIVDMDLPNNTNMQMVVEMLADGTVRRNLVTYEYGSEFEGDMVMAMSTKLNGQPVMQMDAEMPVEIDASQTRRPIED